MSAIIRISIAALLLLRVGSGIANAQEYTAVKMSVASIISGSDLDMSRLAAIAETKKRCVKKVLRSDILGPAEYKKHSKVLDELILNDPDPYVADFIIENEEIIDDGQRYRVSATAKVRKNAINAVVVEEGIGDIFKMGPKPTVMVLIRERFETRVAGTRTAETELIKIFQAKGFKVIDPEQKKLVDLRNRLFGEGTGNMEAALQAAMSFKADYLVLGEAAVTSSGPLSGTDLKARYANMSVKIVGSSSGRIFAMEKSAGKTKHIDELTGGNWALEEAARKIGPKVLDQFKTILVEELQEGAEIVVDIYGLDYESQAEEAETVLKEIENVDSVARRFYFTSVGQFEVKFKGSTTNLAKSLKLAEIDGQPLEVLETLPRYLRTKRAGAQTKIQENAGEIFKKYLDQKYKQFDMEKAREKDIELIKQINKLAQSRKISDEQKKKLYAARQEIEAKRKEAFYRQQELEKRSKQLRQAEAQKKQMEKRMEPLLQEKKKQKEKQKEEHKEKIKELRKKRDELNREVERNSQMAYTASRNYSNASSYAASSSADYAGAISRGFSLARQITSFF
ncbi:MAG: hypothetical protein GY850_19505 [bacterium]|nr:hypothetical protein [bacterium]